MLDDPQHFSFFQDAEFLVPAVAEARGTGTDRKYSFHEAPRSEPFYPDRVPQRPCRPNYGSSQGSARHITEEWLLSGARPWFAAYN